MKTISRRVRYGRKAGTLGAHFRGFVVPISPFLVRPFPVLPFVRPFPVAPFGLPCPSGTRTVCVP